MKNAFRCTLSALALVALGGCASSSSGDSTIGYYWQSFRGHMGIMGAAKPVQDWIDDTSQKPALRERLPTEARGCSCICPDCVAAAHRAAACGTATP